MLTRCGWCLWLAEASYSRGTTNQGPTQVWVVKTSSVFLHSFLRRVFAGKLAALALHNVSYHSRFFDALTNLPQLFKRCIALSSRQITIQRISSREINCVTDWIVIYPMDSVIHLFTNWAPVLLISVSTISTSVTSHLIWYRQTNISPWKVHNMLVLFRCILSKLSYFYFS